jgi:hypothetical protein
VLTIVGKGILRDTDQEEDAVHLFTARRESSAPFESVGAGRLLVAPPDTSPRSRLRHPAAICREREFLADAAAVQFTRNPHGLADALRRIGGTGRPRASHAKAPASPTLSSRLPKTTTATALTRR